ncbi:MAG: cupin domain-containing protein [Deltaproteobacteria bacterium]|jgi:mannose-6-phosphate isomerase-like protein (cupin superfamily)|nr:cupin domain-containing protein [Deltaproteobacteria bacterium]
MSKTFALDATFEKHPDDGVFLKPFFNKADVDGRLNNLEIIVVPGYEIKPHNHPNSTEFFYVVSGEGEFKDNEGVHKIKAGDAFRAPDGVTHSLKPLGNEPLKLLATFCPPIM